MFGITFSSRAPRRDAFAFVSLTALLAACSSAPQSGLFDSSGGSGGGAARGGTSSSGGSVSLGGALSLAGGSANGGATSANGGAVALLGGAPAVAGASNGGAAGSVVVSSGGATTAAGGAPSNNGGVANLSGGTTSGSGGTVSAQGGVDAAGGSVDVSGGALNGGAASGGTASGGTANGGAAQGGSANGGSAGSATGGSGGSCSPATEICDGVDNDCNTMIDEKACPTKCTGFVAAGRRFMVCNVSVNQENAASMCEKQGMRLAWLDSADKVSAVLSSLQGLGKAGPGGAISEVYIGATDVEQEGHWHWIGGANFWLGDENGKAVDGAYNNWSKNRPNNFPVVPGEDCAVSVVDFPNDGDPGEWNDVTCSEQHGALCEVP